MPGAALYIWNVVTRKIVFILKLVGKICTEENNYSVI